jgi:hypothetical protein
VVERRREYQVLREKRDERNIPRRATLLVAGAKLRAKRVGTVFALTRDDIIPALSLGVCQATGLKLDFTRRVRRGPRCPSLDRVDPKKGYVPDNVQIVCWQYNAAKGAWSNADLVEMAAALVNISKKRSTKH